MRLTARLASLWNALFGRDRLDRDLNDELNAYVEERLDRAAARGTPLADARRQALAEFGSAAAMKRRLREERMGLRVIARIRGFWTDVRLGSRRLLGTPRFTVPAFLSLGLGSGIAIATFGVVDALMLRPAAVTNGGELLVIAASRPPSGTLRYLSYPNYLDVRARASALRDLVAYAIVDARLITTGMSIAVHSQAVSDNYFQSFGARPWRGRLLTTGDAAPGAEPAIVLSHALSERVFGPQETGVGAVVRLNGQPFAVVGVAPDTFRGTDALFRADLWIPLAAANQAGLLGLADRTARNIRVQGFAADGIALSQVKANLKTVAARLREDYPVQNDGLELVVRGERSTRPIIDAAGLLFPVSTFLMTVALLGLVTDVASVTGLLLARGISRRQETSIRIALGASLGRVVREQLVESVLLAGASAACGFAVASWALGILSKMELPGGMVLDARPGWLVAGFAIALPIVIGVAAGILPALTAARGGLVNAAADGARATAGQKAGRMRERVVAVQYAGLTVLLAVMALFTASIQEAQHLDLGFATSDRLLLTVAPEEFGYDAQQGRHIVGAFLDRVKDLPGVVSAAAVYEPPLGAGSSSISLAPGNGAQPRSPERIGCTVVTPGYFETLAIPLLAGRAFNDRDGANTTPVVVVNEWLAKTYWPDQEAVGRRLVVPDETGIRATFEIVGVAATSKYQSASEAPRGFVWFPYSQSYRGAMTLVVHTTGGAHENAIISSARGILTEVGGAARLSNVTTFSALAGARTTGRLVAGAWFVGIVAWLAFLRASFSLYSLLTYTVQFRAREFAIRMALGAGRRDVFRFVLRRTLLLALAGITIGLVAAVAISQALRSVLGGTARLGPAAWCGVPLLLTAVAIASSYLPLRRLFKQSPVLLLKSE
jgi:predicted permease